MKNTGMMKKMRSIMMRKMMSETGLMKMSLRMSLYSKLVIIKKTKNTTEMERAPKLKN